MGMKEFSGGVDRLLELNIGWPAALLTYRTPKYLVIDYWLVVRTGRGTLRPPRIRRMWSALARGRPCV